MKTGNLVRKTGPACLLSIYQDCPSPPLKDIACFAEGCNAYSILEVISWQNPTETKNLVHLYLISTHLAFTHFFWQGETKSHYPSSPGIWQAWFPPSYTR